LARSEASGLRSSWLASAKNRRVSCWLASRSAIEVSHPIARVVPVVP
jgi:hypothetical protein